MDDRTLKGDARGLSLRDRRYCIRYPFAADVELLDLESGAKTEGVTSDISMGGAFACTRRALPSHTPLRITLIPNYKQVAAPCALRIRKPRTPTGNAFCH